MIVPVVFSSSSSLRDVGRKWFGSAVDREFFSSFVCFSAQVPVVVSLYVSRSVLYFFVDGNPISVTTKPKQKSLK